MKKINVLILLSFCSIQVFFAQLSFKPKLDSIDSLIIRVQNTLSKEWFVEKKANGFDVFFCRSCNENYIDSINNTPSYNRKNIQNNASFKFFTREHFFERNGPDSVSYYSTVSQEFSTNEIRKYYEANGVMKIMVRLEQKWSKKKYKSIQNKNNTLKNEITKKSLGKSNMTIFEDYRFWVPNQPWLLNRIKDYDFSFQQLPYTSDWFEYSIFIYQDKPTQFCNIMYCDPLDNLYYKNKRNKLEHERLTALTSIAYALGIKNYKVLN